MICNLKLETSVYTYNTCSSKLQWLKQASLTNPKTDFSKLRRVDEKT